MKTSSVLHWGHILAQRNVLYGVLEYKTPGLCFSLQQRALSTFPASLSMLEEELAGPKQDSLGLFSRSNALSMRTVFFLRESSLAP